MSAPSQRAALAAGVAVAAALHVTPAWAQRADAGEPERLVAPIEQSGRIYGGRAQVEAGTGDGSATIAVGIPLDDWKVLAPSSAGSDSMTRHGSDSLNLILSTPWNGSDDAAPATLDGLANGTKLTFRWSRLVTFTRNGIGDEMIDIADEARRACRAKAEEDFQNATQRLAHTADADLPADDPSTPANETAEARARRSRIIDADRDRSLDACAFPPGGIGNLVNRSLPARARDFVLGQVPRSAHEYGAEASIGRHDFDFIDPATLGEGHDRRVQWNARGYYTQYFRQSRTALTFSIAYERAYKAADEATFCPANPNNIVVRCTTAAGGPPERDESLLFALGLRHQFTGDSFLSNMAVAPLVTYDALDDVLAVDVPVYFIPNSDGGLISGVRFGYRSDQDHHFTVGVFIGAAFSIFQ